MAADSPRDFKMVLFPPVMLFFFLGVLAGPPALLLYFLVSPNVGLIFIAVGVCYFLTYEWLHFSYHLPPESFAGRLWLVRKLRRHHTLHHDKSKMGRWNFNITFPICDLIFGTSYRDSSERGSPRP
jgi:sterol desaturase/sphingolipid hydroxylase (fatty acid hydroxylase superfamily)